MKQLLCLVLLVLIAAVLSGCSLIAQAPTLKHCDQVAYVRNGAQIDIQAKCSVPLGGVPGL